MLFCWCRCGSQKKKTSRLPWQLCNVYYCYNSPSLKGSDVWTVAPAQCQALSLSSTDYNAVQVSTELVFVLLSPPPPWEYCQTHLIAPTLEQLTQQSGLMMESTRWWNLTLWHVMWLRFQTTFCAGSWQVTWDFLLNLDNISSLHSPTWKIVWECKMILCLPAVNELTRQQTGCVW